MKTSIPGEFTDTNMPETSNKTTYIEIHAPLGKSKSKPTKMLNPRICHQTLTSEKYPENQSTNSSATYVMKGYTENELNEDDLAARHSTPTNDTLQSMESQSKPERKQRRFAVNPLDQILDSDMPIVDIV